MVIGWDVQMVSYVIVTRHVAVASSELSVSHQCVDLVAS